MNDVIDDLAPIAAHADAAHDRIKARAGDELTWLKEQATTAVMNAPLPPRTKYIRLREIATRAGELVAPDTPCRKGCSHCCYQAVPIMLTEARIIASHTGLTFDRAKGMKPSDQMVAHLHKNCDDRLHDPQPCPFLAQASGECTIYEVRPTSCRTHHVLHPDASRCKLEGKPIRQVRYDLSYIDSANATLALADEMADIREWFA